jgi:hypothetical protein
MKQRGIPILLVVVVAALIIVMRTSPHGQSGIKSDSRAQGKGVEVDKEQWPVTDYGAPELKDSEKRAIRRAKNARHDEERNVREPEDRPGVVYETNIINDWEVGLPALPAYQSDAVIVGEVLDAQAYLSNDKTGVYSEFTVRISDVLKNDQWSHLSEGSSVVAERVGGRVRFPSGKILPVRVSGQGMPRAGRQYVFFLRRLDKEQTYSLLTGYELSAGKVSPLDGQKPNGGGSPWKFDKYENWERGAFLDAVRDAIANPSSQ